MEKQLYMVGGLPRSGSTLIQNILAQNPDIYATSTSPIVDLCYNFRNSWSSSVEHQLKIDNMKPVLHRTMGRIIDSYYEDVSQDIVVDKSRGWIAYFELFENIIPDMKVVVPVRDVRDVLASFEKLRRKQIDMKIPVGEGENFIKFQTTAGRCEYWLQPEQPVGLAINRIEDAIIRGYRDRMLFVEYDDLCREPKETMDRIYDFWGLSNYAHNFDNVEQVTHEDDRVHGFGTSDALHTIKNKVEYIPSDAGVKYLGKRVSEFYSGISRFWRTL